MLNANSWLSWEEEDFDDLFLFLQLIEYRSSYILAFDLTSFLKLFIHLRSSHLII